MRLYPTIIRYDAAYAVLFKCSRKRIGDYPNLAGWLRDMYQLKVEESGMQVFAAWRPWSSASMCAVASFCGPGSFAVKAYLLWHFEDRVSTLLTLRRGRPPAAPMGASACRLVSPTALL